METNNNKIVLTEGPVRDNPTNNGGGYLGTSTTGSAALVQLLISRMMGLYAEITNLDREQKQKMIKAQEKAALSQAIVPEKGGEAQFKYACYAGAVTIVGAGVGRFVIEKLANSLSINYQDFTNSKTTLSNINFKNVDSGFFIQCFAFHSSTSSS